MKCIGMIHQGVFEVADDESDVKKYSGCTWWPLHPLSTSSPRVLPELRKNELKKLLGSFRGCWSRIWGQKYPGTTWLLSHPLSTSSPRVLAELSQKRFKKSYWGVSAVADHESEAKIIPNVPGARHTYYQPRFREFLLNYIKNELKKVTGGFRGRWSRTLGDEVDSECDRLQVHSW